MGVLILVRNNLRNCLRNSAGNATVLFSIAGAIIIGTGGLALDYAHSRMVLAGVQTNLDAAVLAGVSGTLVEDKQIATAQAYFDRYVKQKNVDISARFWLKKGTLHGAVDAEVPTTLLKVLDIDSVTLKARSAATSEAALEPLCFMAMHPSRKHTLELKGSVSVIAPDCNIYGNSNHEFDVVDPHTPQNFLTARFVAAIGGGHHFLENVTPAVEFGTKLIEDPLKSLSVPAAGPCLKTKYTLSGKTLSLPPGHYCGGLTIDDGSKITLEDGGTYFISGGAFEIDEGTVTGKDVTIFLADDRATVEWSEAVVRISAKKTGAYAGIAVFGARVDTDNSFSESTIDIHGVFYMPKGAFEWENVGKPAVTAKWSAFIIDGVSWVGKGVITINFDLAGSDIPYPEDLVVMPRPSHPRLIN